LKEISEGAFDGLSQLRFLRVERNEICSLSTLNLKHAYFRNALSEVKPWIELLDFSGNCFPTITAQYLRNCVKLMYLDLFDNKISEINNFELMNLSQLKQLRLQNNQLSEIHPMAFMNLPQLQCLYMRDNLIGSLHGNRLQAFHRLEILDVTNNILQKKGMLDGVRNLQQLSLRNNSLSSVDENAFASLRQLTTLDLAHNSLTKIPKRTFSHQTKVFWLDLSKNQLTSFEDGTFDAKMANIILNGNPLFCDDECWCLVTNRVRTFLPYQSEITCACPKKCVGVRLKGLMIRKANDTLTEGMKTLGFNKQGQWSPTSALIPGLRGAPTG
uniref:LRRCT domain-containing protein n=1 Tax=Heligmosomoides polygyrus TaxID=6339 RepID=A0A183GSU9_HELPZ